jgi:anti-sigma-K factor RskA
MVNNPGSGDCRDVDQLQGDAALDVLELDDRHFFDRHLASCHDCQRTRDSYVETVGLLGLAAEASTPSPRLGDRIVALARAERASLDDPSASAGQPTRVRSRRQLFAWAAVVVFALIGFAWAAVAQVEASNQRRTVERYQRYLVAHEKAWATLEQQAMVSLELRADAGGQATGRLYLHQESEEAVLIVSGLPTLPENRVYQVWLIRDGQRTSGGLFRVDQSGFGWLKIDAPARLGEFQGVGITPEPPGGSVGPTGARVLGGQL